MVVRVLTLRDGEYVGAFSASSATVQFALNEIRRKDIVITGASALSILPDDQVMLYIGDDPDEYGPYNIVTQSVNRQGALFETHITLAACSDLMRLVAIPGSDPFDNKTNGQTFNAIINRVRFDTGLSVPVTFVNAEAITMDSRFAVNGENAFDSLVSLAAITGNAIRETRGCELQIGKFGELSDIKIGSGGTGVWPGIAYFDNDGVSYERDSSEVVGAVFPVGGTFKKWVAPDTEKTAKDYTLQIGSYEITNYDISPPSGFEIETVESNKKLHYKLYKIGSDLTRSRKVQFGGIIPQEQNDPESERAASQFLAEVSARYLDMKSVPVTRISGAIHGYLGGVLPGDRVRVFLSFEGTVIADEELYVSSITYSIDGESITTMLELSNVLYNPDEILSSKMSKSGESGYHPYQPLGQSATIVQATVGASGVQCSGGLGRIATVGYSAYGFTSVPVLHVIAPFGYSGTVVSATATEASICVVSSIGWTLPVTIKVAIAGES